MANDLAEISAEYRSYFNRLKRELEAATEDVAENLLDKMHELTGLTDHDLADLQALGYPYSRRNPPGTLHPDWEVHRQSGALQEDFRPEHEGVWRDGRVSSEIHNDAQHLWYLLQGTEDMRPRDFASAAILLTIGEAEARYRRAFAAAGGEFRDDGESFIQVDLIPHDAIPAQLPGEE